VRTVLRCDDDNGWSPSWFGTLASFFGVMIIALMFDKTSEQVPLTRLTFGAMVRAITRICISESLLSMADALTRYLTQPDWQAHKISISSRVLRPILWVFTLARIPTKFPNCIFQQNFSLPCTELRISPLILKLEESDVAVMTRCSRVNLLCNFRNFISLFRFFRSLFTF
jgi:hypothetical protein